MPIQPNAPVYADIIGRRNQAVHEEFVLYEDANKQTPVNLTGKNPIGSLVGLGVAPVTYTMPVTITNPPGTDGSFTYLAPQADTNDATITPTIGDFQIWLDSAANVPVVIGRQRLLPATGL